MNAGEIQSALAIVEEDHQLVLEKLQALKEAIGRLNSPAYPSALQAVERLRQMDDYFATRFETHMEQEEKDLFPLLERQPIVGRDLVERLRREHTDIRGKREEFAKCLEVAVEVEDELPRAVLRDLFAYGWELWELLDRHAHAETQAVHQSIIRSLQGEGPVSPA